MIKNLKTYGLLVLTMLILVSCAAVKPTTNYTLGMEKEARIGTALAEWTVGSNWWRWMNNPPHKSPPGTAMGTQLPMTKSLIFVGFDNDNSTIRITYREFIDGIARAAFTQDLTFNVSDKTIVYENFEATIVSVDSKSLKYVVIQEHSDLTKQNK
jgi:hypothetical protein